MDKTPQTLLYKLKYNIEYIIYFNICSLFVHYYISITVVPKYSLTELLAWFVDPWSS